MPATPRQLYEALTAGERDADSRRTVAAEHRSLLAQLLTILDALDRLSAAAVETSSDSVPAASVLLVRGQLWDLLETQGVRRIETAGAAFDPFRHEAVGRRASDRAAESVIEEVGAGFEGPDGMLRPARVVVSAGSGG